jgi:PAS domain S-box-containing protein
MPDSTGGTPDQDFQFNLMKEMLENINEGFFTLDRDWRFTYSNQRAASFLGATPEDMLGQIIWQRFPDLTGTLHEKYYRLVSLENQPQEFDTKGRIPGYWHHVRAYPSVNGISVYWQDISKCKQLEEAHRLGEERFKVLIENLNSGVALLDEHGQFTSCNSSFLRMFGFSLESEILNIKSEDWSAWEVYEEDGKTLLHVDEHPVRKAAITGKPIRNKLVGVRLPSGGDLVWMVINAEPVFKSDSAIRYLVTTYYDITIRKNSEEALRSNNARLKILSESSSLLLSSENPESIVQIVANKAMAHLGCDCFFNYILDEKVGKLKLNAYAGISAEVANNIEWLNYYKDICGSEIREGSSHVMDNIQGDFDMQASLIHFFGILAYVANPLIVGTKTIGTLSFGSRLRNSFKDDEIELMKTLAAQVSVAIERKHVEVSLKRYAAELEAANKELEAFSYSVSHDLRAPLRTMDGFSQIVLEDYGDILDATGKDYLDRLRKASQNMSELIDDLLNLSRVTRTDMYRDKVDLSEIVHSVIEDLQADQPGRKTDLVFHDNIIVNGDKALLTIALKNLLENAWKFTSKCLLTRIEVGITHDNSEAVYFIKDNGVGFDMQYANRLFQPFQRLHTSREYEGTGIGLAIVQRIIRRHEGRIWASSIEGQGATFYFTLG